MKLKTFCVIVILSGSILLKFQLEKDRVGARHLPKSLKPIDASYESNSLKRYAFGFDSLISSLLWLEVLQKAQHTPVKSDEVSWEYAQMEAITTLDPRFDQAYSYGAIFLSLFRRDKLGGKLLLEKWARRNPTYWRPVHMLGMHYYEELGDYVSAAPLILRASNMARAPHWLNSLGLRLLSESGSLINAITTAIEISKTTRSPTQLQFLANRVRSLNYNIQKKEFETRFIKTKAPPERTLASLSLANSSEIPMKIRTILNERFSFKWDPKEKRAMAMDPAIESQLGKTGVYNEPTAVKRQR